MELALSIHGSPPIVEKALDLVEGASLRRGTSLPDGLAPAELASFETRALVSVPDSLRGWLLCHNGASVGPGGLYGVRALRESLDIEQEMSLFPAWRDKGWIPVSGDGCGNRYVCCTEKASVPADTVLFIDLIENSRSPSYAVATSMWHFIHGLLLEEIGETWWPFEKNRVLLSDPALAQLEARLQPWNAADGTGLD